MVWGHFYASPSDVTWGSQDNPDLFVKIWFDVSGRTDVNFFHVSVPDIEVYSDLPDDDIYDQKGTTIMDNRYIRHEFWIESDLVVTAERFNFVSFGSDHATEFTAGLGYINLDGAGNFSGAITQVSQGQSTGSAFDVGPVSGTYSVSSNGQINFSDSGISDNGYVSADGSLIV